MFSAVCLCACVCVWRVRDVTHSHYVTDKKKQSWTKSPELSLWEKETETLLKCQTRVSVYCARSEPSSAALLHKKYSLIYQYTCLFFLFFFIKSYHQLCIMIIEASGRFSRIE